MAATVVQKAYVITSVTERPDGSFTVWLGEKATGTSPATPQLSFNFLNPSADDVSAWGDPKTGGTISGSFTFTPASASPSAPASSS